MEAYAICLATECWCISHHVAAVRAGLVDHCLCASNDEVRVFCTITVIQYHLQYCTLWGFENFVCNSCHLRCRSIICKPEMRPCVWFQVTALSRLIRLAVAPLFNRSGIPGAIELHGYERCVSVRSKSHCGKASGRNSVNSFETHCLSPRKS